MGRAKEKPPLNGNSAGGKEKCLQAYYSIGRKECQYTMVKSGYKAAEKREKALCEQMTFDELEAGNGN